jgi:hypothetical protein
MDTYNLDVKDAIRSHLVQIIIQFSPLWVHRTYLRFSNFIEATVASPVALTVVRGTSSGRSTAKSMRGLQVVIR